VSGTNTPFCSLAPVVPWRLSCCAGLSSAEKDILHLVVFCLSYASVARLLRVTCLQQRASLLTTRPTTLAPRGVFAVQRPK